MRVAEDMWRQGIGTRLAEVVIDWCRDHGVRTLVLNTTTPQKPAIGLYHKLGFERRPHVHRQVRTGVAAGWAVGLSERLFAHVDALC